MDRRIDSEHDRLAVAVSTPGGIARQYRVQYVSDVDHSWRMYAAFNHRDAAEGCLSILQQRGYQARLVRYAICPAAG